VFDPDQLDIVTSRDINIDPQSKAMAS
jgi:hypothetical protein